VRKKPNGHGTERGVKAQIPHTLHFTQTIAFGKGKESKTKIHD
jgi:hypothetical protein